jgi:hypothetical protein
MPGIPVRDEKNRKSILIGKISGILRKRLQIAEHFDSESCGLFLMQFFDDMHERVVVVDQDISGGHDKFSLAGELNRIRCIQDTGISNYVMQAVFSGNHLHFMKMIYLLKIFESIVHEGDAFLYEEKSGGENKRTEQKVGRTFEL